MAKDSKEFESKGETPMYEAKNHPKAFLKKALQDKSKGLGKKDGMKSKSLCK